MFGMFTGRQEAPAAPIAEDVATVVAAPCCSHCPRRRQQRTRQQQLADYVEAPRERVVFDAEFEAEGVRLVEQERAAAAEFSKCTGLLTDRVMPDGFLIPRQLTTSERERREARLARAERLHRKAKLALNAHKAERVRRVRAIEAAKIAERDQRRGAARDDAGLPPLGENEERFTLPADVVAHLRRRP